jgi:hypothetical protein
MELLGTWRELYTLRYCSITLIQTLFSAGTIYILTAIQAGSGIRIAQKELRYSLDQSEIVMQYLNEIGRSWQCANNIAGILKNLHEEQLKPLLERKTIPITSPISGSGLQVPDFVDNDDDDARSTISRTSSKGRANRRPAVSKTKQRQVSHSRKESTGSLALPPSPTIMITRVHRDSTSSTYAPSSSSSARSVTAPIAIQPRPRSTTVLSSSPSSLPTPWLVQPNGSPSPSSSPVFSNFSSSPSFGQHPFPDHSHSLSHGHSIFSGNGPGTNLFNGHSLATNPDPKPNSLDRAIMHSPPDNYPGEELSGFFGMLGGQTLPPTPFVGFNLADTIAPYEELSPDDVFSPSSPFSPVFLRHAPSLAAAHSSSSLIDNDTNMDDGSADWWAQPFD